jgi:hypothetical protein
MKQLTKITYYARVIDNITNEEIVAFTDATKRNTWYYGQINGMEGGESQYIIEFDIWNNEPAFNANTGDVHCMDAKNCRFTVWADSTCTPNYSNPLFALKQPFMYARTTTNGYKDQFVGIKNSTMLNNICGNVNPSDIGVLHGNGDHVIVQTKIILPPQSGITSLRYNFTFGFYYDV